MAASPPVARSTPTKEGYNGLFGGNGRENGELFGWGIDIAGELIFPLEERTYKVKLMDHVVSAGIGSFHCAEVKADGTLWTW